MWGGEVAFVGYRIEIFDSSIERPGDVFLRSLAQSTCVFVHTTINTTYYHYFVGYIIKTCDISEYRSFWGGVVDPPRWWAVLDIVSYRKKIDDITRNRSRYWSSGPIAAVTKCFWRICKVQIKTQVTLSYYCMQVMPCGLFGSHPEIWARSFRSGICHTSQGTDHDILIIWTHSYRYEMFPKDLYGYRSKPRQLELLYVGHAMWLIRLPPVNLSYRSFRSAICLPWDQEYYLPWNDLLLRIIVNRRTKYCYYGRAYIVHI